MPYIITFSASSSMHKVINTPVVYSKIKPTTRSEWCLLVSQFLNFDFVNSYLEFERSNHEESRVIFKLQYRCGEFEEIFTAIVQSVNEKNTFKPKSFNKRLIDPAWATSSSKIKRILYNLVHRD